MSQVKGFNIWNPGMQTNMEFYSFLNIRSYSPFIYNSYYILCKKAELKSN